MRLKGKKVLITGAGQGIGKTSAELFASEGAEVFACDLNEHALSTLQNVTPVVLDVTNAQLAKEKLKEIGGVDVLFNCAGIVAHGSILECSEDDWTASLNVNVTSMFRLIRLCLPAMLEQGSGSILNMASVASSMTGVPTRCAYGASKAAVIGLTKSVAADFVTKGIRCNAICPGTVDSPSLRQRLEATGDFDGAMEAFKDRQPMKRLGTTEEIASLALYLASDESSYVTGQAIAIDGGWTG